MKNTNRSLQNSNPAVRKPTHPSTTMNIITFPQPCHSKRHFCPTYAILHYLTLIGDRLATGPDISKGVRQFWRGPLPDSSLGRRMLNSALKELKEGGLIETERGNGGGYRLTHRGLRAHVQRQPKAPILPFTRHDGAAQNSRDETIAPTTTLVAAPAAAVPKRTHALVARRHAA
jgi:hypothetical protein